MDDNGSPAKSLSESVSNALVSENGSKNKRKFLSDTSLDVQSDASLQSLLDEFPTHEKEKLQTASTELVLLKDNSDDTHEEKEFLKADWDDPIACQLQELLTDNLLTIFAGALKKIVESGYTAEVAEWAILNSGLFHGSKDCVSNVAHGAVALLKGGKELNTSSKHSVFKNTKNLAAYVMLEMIHVLREVRPALTITDAMWCLLISDLNLLKACVVDKLDVPEDSSELPEDKFEYSITVEEISEIPPEFLRKKSDSGRKARWPNAVKESYLDVQHGKGKLSGSTVVDEKSGGLKKGSSANSKRDLLRPKAFKLEKGRISEAAFKTKLAAWESISVASSGVDEVMKVFRSKSSRSSQSGVPAPSLSDKDRVPASNSPASSIPKEKNAIFNPLKVIDYNVSVPQNETEETVLALVSHKKALEKVLQGWTNWANEKIMEVAKRLAKDREELKMLKQEKFEKGKQENTTKRESDQELALSNATGQIEVANFTARRLEEENVSLKEEMKGLELKALGSAHKLQEAVVKEQEVLKKVQLGETEKGLFMEKLRNYKHKTDELEKQVEKAKERLRQYKVLLKHEEKERTKFAAQQETVRAKKEKENNLIKQEAQNICRAAETNLRNRKKDIQDLEKLISELKLKSTKSKIAALSVGYGSSLTGSGTQLPKISNRLAVFQDIFRGENVKPERECVMCMTEEISVVFLPCAHQVLCGECSVRHEKQGMNDCPSCRAKIEKRISAQYRVD